MAPKSSEKMVIAYYPGNDFPSVSVTGTRCDQMCEHCKGVHLRGMIPVSGKDEFSDLAHSFKDKGCTGLLLSGGCDANGSVPVSPYADAISEVSSDLLVNVHAGFITKNEAERLAAFHTVDENLNADAPFLPLLWVNNVVCSRKTMDMSGALKYASVTSEILPQYVKAAK